MIIPFKQIQSIGTGAALLAAGVLLAEAHEQDTGADVKLVRVEKLPNAPGKVLTAVTVNYAPGGKSGSHHHAGSVFAYVLTGAIRSENSATGPVKVYNAGESFFEPPGSVHLVSENASTTEPASLLAVFIADEGAQLTVVDAPQTAASDKDLARQIFETMIQVPGVTRGNRPVHAKGIVCQGIFTPSAAAASVSKAAHFQGAPTPLTVRFSVGSTSPTIPDYSPDAGPRGMAIRFNLPGGAETDIVSMSHNGFVVGNGEEFLALQKALVATDPSKPHPWPIELFVTAHPLALKFVQDNVPLPASFATESYFSNDSFVFITRDGMKQAVRYKIVPAAGQHYLSEAEGKTKSPSFLMEDIKTRLAAEPIKFHLIVQLPNPGDPTNDPSLVWPEDRKSIDLGIISITSIAADSDALQKALAYDPTNLTDGIELSDDPFPALRSRVYSMSVKYRHQK